MLCRLASGSQKKLITFKGQDPKYIAQAGVLRGEPDGITGRCAVFRYGPGLKSY